MFRFLKTVMLVAALTLAIFITLEMFQRIKYTLRFKNNIWMSYGFQDKKKQGFSKIMSNYYRGEQRKFELYAAYYKYKGLPYYKYDPQKYKTPVVVNNRKYTINSFGLRGQEFDKKKTDGIFRIVTLGASSTFGVDNDDEFTYPKLLEVDLNADYASKRFEVINAGIPSYSINELYALFAAEIIDFKPDLITINSLCNDWILGRLSGRNPLVRLHLFLLGKSLFYTTFSEKMAILSKRGAGGAYRNDKKAVENYKERLIEIINLAKSKDVRVIIIKQPLNFSQQQEAYHASFYQILDEVSGEYGIPEVDAAGVFEKMDKKELFTDVVHLTDNGNQILARLIYRKITELGWK